MYDFPMEYYYRYSTSIGGLYIVEKSNKICAISATYDTSKLENFESKLIRKTYDEICEYFSGLRQNFDIPISFEGTEFQKTVWQELISIPYSKTRTYKDIAQQIGKPKAYRAVGNACNRNKLLILVPCHRVIGSNNSLTGFALGTDIKRKLLKIEAEKCMKN